MAIPKKKIAGKKPVMKKSPIRKAQNGETVERGMTSEVKARPTFRQNMREDFRRISDTESTDYQNTPAKTKAGKILRGANEAASMLARDLLAPVGIVASLGGNAIKAVSNAIKAKKEIKAIKKNGGSLKPVPAGKKGLAKLPKPVRKKMGFQKNGGKLKK